jgi:threonine/homoserine/homoserine lactone efflux protein
MLLDLLVGFALGFAGSIPVAGPISVLVLAMGIGNRMRTAVGVAAGGALAEAIYAFLAFWGFSQALARHPVLLDVSRGTTALVLLLVGILLVRKKKPEDPSGKRTPKDRAGNSVAAGFTISILNPTLMVTWAATTSVVFSTGLLTFRPSEALPFSLGVCLGILGWFSLLLGLVSRYRERFSTAWLDRIVFWMGCAVLLGASVTLVYFLGGLFS